MYSFIIIILLNIIIHASNINYDTVAFTSSNLPIVIINTDGRTIEVDNRIIADMKIISNEYKRNNTNDIPNNYDGRIAIELRGQSSLKNPKKSFRFETQDSLGENLNVSLLELPKENDWILYAPYNDKSLIRNALVYKIASEIMGYAPRYKYCELVLNGEYNGVYLLVEKIKLDKNRIDLIKMSKTDLGEPEVSGGYIFKKDKESSSDNIIKLNRGLELIITEPKKNDIAEEQILWLKNHLNSFDKVLFSGGNYNEFIDVNSFVNNYLIVELTKNIDGYRRSTYFHKDRGGKITSSSVWDYNLSLGNADFNNGWDPVGWYLPIIQNWDKNWWVKLKNNKSFNDLCISRWKELRIKQLDETVIMELIDELSAPLQESQERNFERWPILDIYTEFNPGFPESGHFGFKAPITGGNKGWLEHIEYVKNFIADRITWMDKELGYVPVAVESAKISETSSFTLYPNYPNPFNSTTTFRYSITEQSEVNLSLYDITGQLVKTIFNKYKGKGDYSFRLNTTDLSSGTYIYLLRSGKHKLGRKMVLLK